MTKITRYKLEKCLNCHEPLVGQNFCPQCGQENTDRDLSILTLVGDFLRDYLSFDSKFFRTMAPLMFKPGRVPKEFIEGKRARHIPPFRILLFSSFLFFFIWGLSYDFDENNERISDGVNSVLNSSTDEEAQAVVDSLANSNVFELNIHGLDSAENELEKDKIGLLKNLLDQGLNVDMAVDSISDGSSPLEKKLYRQLGRFYSSDSATITKYFIGNLSFIILVIQPFFAFLLWLVYIRRRKEFRFIKHLIFSFYFHSWVLVLCTISLLLLQVFEEFNAIGFVMMLALLYLFFSIKNFYGQGWMKTVFKTFLTGILYCGILIPIFLIISVFISFYFF